jgi:hypothetical protein
LRCGEGEVLFSVITRSPLISTCRRGTYKLQMVRSNYGVLSNALILGNVRASPEAFGQTQLPNGNLAATEPTTSSPRCSRRRVARPSRRGIPCQPNACAGSTSSTSTKHAAAMCRRLRAASKCIGAPCSEFLPNAQGDEHVG